MRAQQLSVSTRALGASTLTGGEFVDAAMLGAARQIVAIGGTFRNGCRWTRIR